MKRRKCKICKKRDSNTRHAKDYNHDNPLRSNSVHLDIYCHRAFHQLNLKNSLDWDFMMQNKKQEIIELGDKLAKEGR